MSGTEVPASWGARALTGPAAAAETRQQEINQRARQGPGCLRRHTMRRSTPLAAIAGFALAAVLFVAGGLLLWGSTYTHNMVHNQLAAQQIFFPPKVAFAHPKAGTEITPSMVPSVSQYAGQQLVTGQQAQSYADNFIAVHIANMTGGQTYAQLSAKALANPDDTKLAGEVATVFKGETLRASLFGLTIGRHPEILHEVIEGTPVTHE